MQSIGEDMQKIIMVLAASVAAAFLLTTFFITHYGPSGNYTLSQSLLNPETLGSLNYNDWNPKTSEQDRYIFDHILYESGLTAPKKVSMDQYKKIYQLLNGDTSVSGGLAQYPSTSPKLILYVRTESPSKWQYNVKAFQQLEIDASGNYYRVELHEDNKGMHWVEFPHKNVKEQVEALIHD